MRPDFVSDNSRVGTSVAITYLQQLSEARIVAKEILHYKLKSSYHSYFVNKQNINVFINLY